MAIDESASRKTSGRGRGYRIVNARTGTVLADKSRIADKFLVRGIGLMGRRSLPEGGGLIIKPCSSVVTFFMRFPIDVLFVDDVDTIRHIANSLVPWRVSRIVRGAKYVIELPAGMAEHTETRVGDALEVSLVPAGSA